MSEPLHDDQMIEALQAQVEQLSHQVEEKEEAYRRALADGQNIRRQAQNERKQIIQMGCAELIADILPTLDHLEMALQHFADPSLKMIVTELQRVLKQHGLEKITAGDQEFDPAVMEAVEIGEGKANHVIRVQQPGYTLNGSVLRHAKVVVGGGESGEEKKS